MGFLANLFGGSRNGQAPEAEGSEIRIARLEKEVRSLKARTEDLEAQSIDRTATLLNAADKLNRASERYRKQRAHDSSRSDDGSEPNDWQSAYYALRGRRPFADQAGQGSGEQDNDVTEEGE